jgi:hypothetical protein
LNLLIIYPYEAEIVAPVSERFQSVPLEKAKIAAPAAPLETYTSVPAPASEADGAVATVYVGTLISPIKPAVEVTGPENVVEAILVPFA